MEHHSLAWSTVSGSVATIHLITKLVFVLNWDKCEELILTMGARRDRN